MKRNGFKSDLQEIVLRPAPTTVGGALTRMKEIQRALGGWASACPLAAFNFLYHEITETVLAMLKTADPAPGMRHDERGEHGNHPLTGWVDWSIGELSSTSLFDFGDEDDDDDGADWTNAASLDEEFTNLPERLWAGFEDPDFMATLDVEFARLYFGHLEAWVGGEPVPECWRVLFQHWDNKRGEGPFTGALLGVNAHINHDLAIAVEAAHRKTDVAPIVDGSPRHRDYLLINDIFLVQTPLLHRQLRILLAGPRRLLWAVLGCEPLTDGANHLLEQGRNQAWKHAKQIASGEIPLVGERSLIDPSRNMAVGLIATSIRDSWL